MHKKIVNELVSNNQYFTEQSTFEYSNHVGINDHYFMCDEKYDGYRQNIWYFSNEFEKILTDYKNNKKSICDDESISLNTNRLSKKDIDYDDVKKLFIENKDKLKDLAWIIVGYY